MQRIFKPEFKRINKSLLLLQSLLFIVLVFPFFTTCVEGAGISPEVKKELGSLKKELSQVARTVKAKEYANARIQLKDINSRFDKLIKESDLDEKKGIVKSIRKLIKRREEDILKRDSKSGPVFGLDENMKNDLFPVDDEKMKAREDNGKVSFSKDIAPFLVNLCLRCHNSQKKESDFSLETFDHLMKGGATGTSITPGNLDKSYLWSLVGKQDPIKMPQGQARITRTNWNDLKNWILEGAKYDGGNSQAKLKDLVPSEKEMSQQKMRKLTSDEFQKMRESKTRAYWKQFNPNKKPNELLTSELILLGDVEVTRLQEYASLLQESIKLTRQIFKTEDNPLFRGRLAVFVLKDRFSFDEFHFIINKQQVPKDIHSTSRFTSAHEDAWIVFHDRQQQDQNKNELSFALEVQSQLIESYLSVENSKMPFWIRKGAGLVALSAQKKYRKELRALNSQSIAILGNKYPPPEKLFDATTFLNSELKPVSLSLAGFFVQFKGENRFLLFVKEIQKGTSQTEAMKKVYGQPPAIMGRLFYQKLR